jgi:hypothetical protein
VGPYAGRAAHISPTSAQTCSAYRRDASLARGSEVVVSQYQTFASNIWSLYISLLLVCSFY